MILAIPHVEVALYADDTAFFISDKCYMSLVQKVTQASECFQCTLV